MKRKRLLTLEDLVKFCKEQKLYSFSSKDSGYQLCVRVPASFEKKEAVDSSLFFGTVKAFHTGKNRNESNVTNDAMENSKSTFAYKPILAAFTTDANGDEDFMSHEMEMDDDGNIVYIEHQVGCFTIDEPWIEADSQDANKNWIFATCAIPREYTHAADIIERKGGTKVSVELIVNKFSYDENDDSLLLEDIEVSGLTLLGVYEEGADPDDGGAVEEGMEGARLDIADFSKQKNSVLSYEELTDVIKETVTQALNDMNNSKEGGQKTMKYSEEKLNELLEKFSTKSEDLNFDLETIESDEALESAFEAQFSNPSEETVVTEEKQIEMSLKLGEETRTFAKSLADVIFAITDLVNSTYADSDGTLYACDCFDGGTAKSRYVIMKDMFGEKAYKQSYTIKDGVYSLKGEREQVYAEWCTATEREQLDAIRSNYSAVNDELAQVKDKLSKYESEPDKMAILESADYSSIFGSTEFEDLKIQENHFDLTLDEVRAKADQILLNAAKSGKVDFSAHETTETTVVTKPLPKANTVQKRFGGLL